MKLKVERGRTLSVGELASPRFPTFLSNHEAVKPQTIIMLFNTYIASVIGTVTDVD